MFISTYVCIVLGDVHGVHMGGVSEDDLKYQVHGNFYLLFKDVSLIGLELCHRGQATWSTGFYGHSCLLLPLAITMVTGIPLFAHL